MPSQPSGSTQSSWTKKSPQTCKFRLLAGLSPYPRSMAIHPAIVRIGREGALLKNHWCAAGDPESSHQRTPDGVFTECVRRYICETSASPVLRFGQGGSHLPVSAIDSHTNFP